jgi:hypothetical protein
MGMANLMINRAGLPSVISFIASYFLSCNYKSAYSRHCLFTIESSDLFLYFSDFYVIIILDLIAKSEVFLDYDVFICDRKHTSACDLNSWSCQYQTALCAF